MLISLKVNRNIIIGFFAYKLLIYTDMNNGLGAEINEADYIYDMT